MIECIVCKKKAEKKESVSFYTKWLEYSPDIWICRECKNKFVDSSLITYKFNAIARHIEKSADDKPDS
ncbi:MAG: hypothetical protein GF329_04555 [Candidatus Lokiarchaeota archaeon]|nr:hypothetical protein [Candidatus Lokiarchaeota archaeon]